jgi:hypothetical protein
LGGWVDVPSDAEVAYSSKTEADVLREAVFKACAKTLRPRNYSFDLKPATTATPAELLK